MVCYHALEIFLSLRLPASWTFNFNLQSATKRLYYPADVGLAGYAKLDEPFAVVERSGIVAPDRYRVFKDPVHFQNYISLYGCFSYLFYWHCSP